MNFGFLISIWNWLNGKKTLIGALVGALVAVGDQLGILLPLFGASAVFTAKVAAAILFVVGLGHKLLKALGAE